MYQVSPLQESLSTTEDDRYLYDPGYDYHHDHGFCDDGSNHYHEDRDRDADFESSGMRFAGAIHQSLHVRRRGVLYSGRCGLRSALLDRRPTGQLHVWRSAK